MEKWEDRKWQEDGKVEGWKSGRIEKILISLFFVWLGMKKWRNRKNDFV